MTEPIDWKKIKRVAELLIAHYSLLLRNPIPDDDPQWVIDALRVIHAASVMPDWKAESTEALCSVAAPAQWNGFSGCLLPAGHLETEHAHVK